MKLSLILELLLVFVLVSFVASRTVQRQPKLILASELHRQNDEDNSIIDEPSSNDVNQLTESPIIDDDEDVIEEESSGGEEINVAQVEESETNDAATDVPVNVDDRPPINKYCSCSNAVCNCCRDFSLPIVPVRGPGCAEIKYLKNDRLSVTVKYGDFVLANRIVKAGTSKPICIPLPGGFSRFCGRIYGVQRVKEDFKACLGLELRADEEVEAALKVSCFKFGERGLAVTEADPLPAIENEAGNDDDDDDDLFGLGGGDGGDDEEDDDDDDSDSSAGGADDDDDDLFGLGGDDDDEDDESGTSDDSPDYSGFSLISDGFEGIFGDDDNSQKKKKVITKTKNSNGTIEGVKNTTLVDENKNDKDAIVPLIPLDKPITVSPVEVTPTKPKKKKPSGGLLDALLGDDDDDEDEKDGDDDDEDDDDEDDDDDDEDDDEDKEQTDEDAEKEEETPDSEPAEPEEDIKDETEEETDVAESVDDDDNEEEEEEEEGTEDDDDIASNETDDSQKVNSSDKNKKKKKDDYYGYLSRLMKIF